LYRFLIKKTITIKNKLYFSKKENFDYLELQLIVLDKLKTINKKYIKKQSNKRLRKEVIFKRITILNLSQILIS